jgi:hypothetical protein
MKLSYGYDSTILIQLQDLWHIRMGNSSGYRGPNIRPGWTDPLIAPMVKSLKLAICLFLDFWLQIWFQKYYISPNDTQFLINKHKNKGKF